MVTDVPTVSCALIMSSVLLASYLYVFGESGSYLTNEWWLGLDKKCVYCIVAFQVIAAISFCGMVVEWGQRPPEGGLLDHKTRPCALPLCVFVLLLCSSLWAFSLNKSRMRMSTIATLIAVAICGIFLIAGAFTEDHPRATLVVFSMLFGLVVVLGDGVGWNARYTRFLMQQQRQQR